MPKAEEAERLEESLIDFVEEAWPHIDPSPFQRSWALEALCRHLEAVTREDIDRLLANEPPRCGKSNVVSIAWVAWTWAQSKRSFRSGPQVRFLCGSYNHDLSLQNSNKTRRLILSPWYQGMWGKRFILRDDQNTKTQFDNSEGGSRIATSVSGSLLGIGGDVVIVDDPENIEGAESAAERATTSNWWKEISSTRLNDPKLSAIVVIMQRLNEDDVSGQILNGDDAGVWTHFMVPMRHDVMRHCQTVLSYDENGDPLETWEDPRTEEGELLWPERFGEKEVTSLENSLGPYFASGRLQQSPSPKGGGIFQTDWWQLFPKEGEKFDAEGKPLVKLEYPQMDFIMASVDTAMTTKQENDYSALVVFGVWTDSTGIPKAMLMDAWQERLEFFPLVEKIMKTCKDRKVDLLLIEAKANGISVGQEIQRLTAGNQWAVKLDVPDGDKVSRAYGVQHLFSNKLIYAPNRKWSDMVINTCSKFPKVTHDDLVDAVVAAMRYMRRSSLLELKDEINESLNRRFGPIGQPDRLYPSL